MKPQANALLSHNGFIIHIVILFKADRPYKATVVYSDIPRQTVIYQLRIYHSSRL